MSLDEDVYDIEQACKAIADFWFIQGYTELDFLKRFPEIFDSINEIQNHKGIK